MNSERRHGSMHIYIMTAMLAAAAMAAGCGGSDAKSKLFTDASALAIINPQNCQRFYLTDTGGGDAFTFGKSDSELGLDEQRVFAAVFDKYPQVQGGRIVNPEDAKWVWHSGMRADTSALTGKLLFSDGIDPDKTGAPKGLKSCGITNTCSALVGPFDRAPGDKLYFFVMWAWNGDREISYFSDQAVKFCFTNDATKQTEACKDCR